MHSQNQKKLFKKWVLGVHKNEKKYALPFGSSWVKCTPNWECIGVQRSTKKCIEVPFTSSRFVGLHYEIDLIINVLSI